MRKKALGDRGGSVLLYFDRKGCSPALAKKMRAFIKPMLDGAKDRTPEMEDRLWTIGGLFWNIALNPDEAGRKKAVADAAKRSEVFDESFYGVLCNSNHGVSPH